MAPTQTASDEISVPHIGSVAVDDWAALLALLDSAETQHLDQSWLPESKREFAGGWSKVGWCDDHLVCFANFIDHDIFNDEDRFNAPGYVIGDVYEIFVKRDGSPSYLEIHVSPRNQVLQLRWPRPIHEIFAPKPRRRFRLKRRLKRGFRRRNPEERQKENSESLAPFLIENPRITTAARHLADEHAWQAVAFVPFSLIGDQPAEPGSKYRYSASRYDYTRGKRGPIISSSSPHHEANFHLSDDWRTLRLDD